MGKPTAVDAAGGLRIQYVKRRQVLRVVESGRGSNRSGVEIPLEALRGLEIEHDAVAAPRRYLLFAGDPNAGGVTGAFVASFETEEEARASFHRLRMARAPAWTELAVLDGSGRLRRLCWAGPQRGRDGAPEGSWVRRKVGQARQSPPKRRWPGSARRPA